MVTTSSLNKHFFLILFNFSNAELDAEEYEVIQHEKPELILSVDDEVENKTCNFIFDSGNYTLLNNDVIHVS